MADLGGIACKQVLQQLQCLSTSITSYRWKGIDTELLNTMCDCTHVIYM